MKKVLLVLILFVATFAYAQIPKTLSFQGVLVDPATGQAVADATYTFKFSIYNVATGGTELWTETQPLTTAEGQYSAILGSVAPIDITGTESYWIGVNVNTNELGRVKLTSAAYLLDDDLEDLADGSLSGSKVGAGIPNSSTTATDANTANAIVARDASKNFSAGTITAALNGNAATATTATTASRLTVTSGSPAQICCGGDVTLAGTAGFMYIGTLTGDNIVYDDNEIQARNNGAFSTLYLNKDGGIVKVGTTTVTSDLRLKSNILGLNYGLKEIMLLNPVSFIWKKDPGSGTQLGFIAQEVERVIGELVYEGTNKDDMLSVNYIGLIPVLIKAMQEQQAQIEELKVQVKKIHNSVGTTASISDKE